MKNKIKTEIPSHIIIPPALSGLNYKKKVEEKKEEIKKEIKEQFISSKEIIGYYNGDKAIIESFDEQSFPIIPNLPSNWKNYSDVTDKNATKAQLLCTRPMYQQNCGSCYAFAVANAISDAFIFSPDISLDFNPKISPMTILSFVKIEDNSQCNGGNPIATLQYIAKNGILSSYCQSYSELINKNVYTPPPIGKGKGKVVDGFNDPTLTLTEFETDTSTSIDLWGNIIYNVTAIRPDKSKFSCNIDLATLTYSATNDDGSTFSFSPFISNNKNFYIPDSMCYGSDKDPHYQYFINQPITIATSSPIDPQTKTNSDIERIKSHLYRYGTAVTAFMLYQNFIEDSTIFASTKGIYFESEDYGSKQPTAKAGGHAVCLVGWGIENGPITLSNGLILKDVPYWVCRNSWSQTWGDRGYFKIAFYQKINDKYEINPNTALERYHTYVDNGIQYKDQGGIIVFTPKASFSKYEGNYQKDSSSYRFYQNENSPFGKPQNITPVPTMSIPTIPVKMSPLFTPSITSVPIITIQPTPQSLPFYSESDVDRTTFQLKPYKTLPPPEKGRNVDAVLNTDNGINTQKLYIAAGIIVLLYAVSSIFSD